MRPMLCDFQHEHDDLRAGGAKPNRWSAPTLLVDEVEGPLPNFYGRSIEREDHLLFFQLDFGRRPRISFCVTGLSTNDATGGVELTSTKRRCTGAHKCRDGPFPEVFGFTLWALWHQTWVVLSSCASGLMPRQHKWMCSESQVDSRVWNMMPDSVDTFD